MKKLALPMAALGVFMPPFVRPIEFVNDNAQPGTGQVMTKVRASSRAHHYYNSLEIAI